MPAIGGGGSPSSGGVNGASTVSRVALILLALAVAGLIGLVVVAIVASGSWIRRWREASTGPDRVLVTWQDLADGLRRTGVAVPASDTPQEVADRVGPMLDGEDGDRPSGAGVSSDALEELARQATAAPTRASRRRPTPTSARSCGPASSTAAVARLPWRRRLTWRLSRLTATRELEPDEPKSARLRIPRAGDPTGVASRDQAARAGAEAMGGRRSSQSSLEAVPAAAPRHRRDGACAGWPSRLAPCPPCPSPGRCAR